MRINKFVAQSTGMSRRAADTAITEGRVLVNGAPAEPGVSIENQKVTLDGLLLKLPTTTTTIMINKPYGYVCSRSGQGSKTVYDLLPPELHHLKPVGRLDRNSTGLLLMTDDGTLAHRLTHPSFRKQKLYEITLDKPLEPLHHQMINDHGIMLYDGLSRLGVSRINDGDNLNWRIAMREGRNKQIRRTFDAVGYTVTKLHRYEFGEYRLGQLSSGKFQEIVIK